MKRKLITVFDIFIISLVVILCFCCMLFSLGSNSGQKAVVIINDKGNLSVGFVLDDFIRGIETKTIYPSWYTIKKFFVNAIKFLVNIMLKEIFC